MLMLDLGCGSEKHKGFIGVDMRRLKGVDIIADANKLPFKDDCFDRIILQHIVEHVYDVVAFMKEIWRVSNNGAAIHIWTPHFTSIYSYRDPTHIHHFARESLDYFDGTAEIGKKYKFSNEFEFRVKNKRITFTKRMFWNYAVESFANRYSAIYERIFGWIFSADDLYFELTAVKTTSK